MEQIQLFLSPAEEKGTQTLEEGLDPAALAAVDDSSSTEAKSFRDAGENPNSVAAQGWGVVVPDNDRGNELLHLARPLLEKRAADMGKRVENIDIYRIPPDMSAADALVWQSRAFKANKEEEDIPAYLAILGDFHEVSVDTQRALSTYSRVGRLAFDDDRDYGRYGEKIAHFEAKKPEGKARALFFTARDGTPATILGDRLLVKPALADAKKKLGKKSFPASEVVPIFEEEPEDAGSRLIEVASSQQPSMLFSCSHGMGAPRKGWGDRYDKQRALQGAICLGDGEFIQADDLRETPFLPGGIWMFFACFGAGTPGASKYAHWLSNLKGMGQFSGALGPIMKSLPKREKPFVAALPKAVLANPNGPLAVIGHVDLAWSYSFQDLDTDNPEGRHRRFNGLLKQLVKSGTVGFALEQLLATRAEIQSEITVSQDMAMLAKQFAEDVPDDRLRMGHRWMLHQDLDGYILLGDPAARMAIDPEGKRQDEPKPPPVPEIVQSSDQRADAGSPQQADAYIPGYDGPSAGRAPSGQTPTDQPIDQSNDQSIDQPIGRSGDEPIDFGWFGKDDDDGKDGKQAADGDATEPESQGFLARITQSLTRALGDALEDAATLEVKTYTGDNVAGGTRLADDPNVQLLALTRSKLDGDIEQFWSTGEGEGNHRELRALHMEMVKQAQAHRNELLRMLVSLFQRD